MLDQVRTNAVGALVDESTAQAAIAASARKGYLDGRRLAEIFAWLRPGDLIWNYWVNNYLLGREPARFDILFWNADTTRMTAGLHRDFVRAALDNALASPGGLTVLGTEIDLSRVDLDSYVVAGVADHICPWQSCYRGAQLLGGKTRFVLSSSGHIAALVNPAGNKKSGYQVSDDVTADAESWQRAARRRAGIVVAGLRQLAGGTVRRPDPGAARAGRQALPGHRAPPRAVTCAPHEGAASGPGHHGDRRRPPAARRDPPRHRRRAAAPHVQRHRHPPRGARAVHQRPRSRDRGGAVRRARSGWLAGATAALYHPVPRQARRADARRARLRPLRRLRDLLGRRARPAARAAVPATVPAPRAGRHLDREPDDPGQPPRAAAPVIPAQAPGSRARRADRGDHLRRRAP